MMRLPNPIAISIAVLAAFCGMGVTASASAQSVLEKREERRKAREESGPLTRTGELSTSRGSISRRTEGDIDTESGRAYRSRTVTGPEGQTGSVAGELNRTDTGYTASQTVTDRDGQTAGRTATQSLEEGRLSRERSAYSRNGEAATASDTIERTDNGATRAREFGTSTGRGGAVNSELQRLDDGAAYSRTVTNAEGETVATRDSTVTNSEDGLSRTTTVTGEEDE